MVLPWISESTTIGEDGVDAIYAKVMITNLLPPVNAMDLPVMTTAQELVSALKAHYHYHHKTI